jgi:hypothetical protein
VKTKWLLIVFWGPPNKIIAIFFFPQLFSLFPPLRQVAPPAIKFVDERPLLNCQLRELREMSSVLSGDKKTRAEFQSMRFFLAILS